jgi:hypothetical protein
VSQDSPNPGPPDVPDGWDQLERPIDPPVAPSRPRSPEAEPHEGVAVIPVIAGSWGDLAVILGLTAASLVALKLAGHGAPFAAAPWAVAVAVLWWLVAAAVLLTVRRGTPGMMAAGVSFAGAVAPARLPVVLLAALLLALTLGLPSAVGPPGWALRIAAGTPLTTSGHDLP